MPSSVPPPHPYLFNFADQATFGRRSWRMPLRLGRSGLLRELWRVGGRQRGGGAAASVLPVLALHSFVPRGKGEDPWTPWAYLSRRRLARLSGLDKDTATEALRQLRAMRLIQTEKRSHEDPRMRGGRTFVRLSAGLFPKRGEHVAVVPGALIYGGTWSLLPTAAARQLYLVLAAQDPIGSEDAYTAKRIQESARSRGLPDPEPAGCAWEELDFDVMAEAILAARRDERRLSLSAMAELAGMRRSTAALAVRALLSPLPVPSGAARSLVRRGHVAPGVSTWYAPDREAARFIWPVELLNDPAWVVGVRQRWAQSAAP